MGKGLQKLKILLSPCQWYPVLILISNCLESRRPVMNNTGGRTSRNWINCLREGPDRRHCPNMWAFWRIVCNNRTLRTFWSLMTPKPDGMWVWFSTGRVGVRHFSMSFYCLLGCTPTIPVLFVFECCTQTLTTSKTKSHTVLTSGRKLKARYKQVSRAQVTDFWHWEKATKIKGKPRLMPNIVLFEERACVSLIISRGVQPLLTIQTPDHRMHRSMLKCTRLYSTDA